MADMKKHSTLGEELCPNEDKREKNRLLCVQFLRYKFVKKGRICLSL